MDSTATLVLVIALFIIMIGMGLSLTLDDFKRVLKHPKAVFLGFLNQIILLPLLAFGLITLLNVEPMIAMGVIILSACPGGPTSNLVTHLAKADTALSVSLTAVNSLITIISIPIIVNLGLTEFIDPSLKIVAPVGQIAASLIVVIAIPLTIGMLVKRYSSNFAAKMDKPVRIASALVITLVIVGLVIKERAHFMDYFERSLIIVLLLNIVTMSIGFLSGRIAKLNFKQSLTICIESGNQNGTLAIHVAVVSLATPEFAIAAAVYSLLMYVTAIVPVSVGILKNKKATIQS